MNMNCHRRSLNFFPDQYIFQFFFTEECLYIRQKVTEMKTEDKLYLVFSHKNTMGFSEGCST